MQIVKKAVLETIIYFDIFDYPLSLLEIYLFLYLPYKQRKFFKVDVIYIYKVVNSLLEQGKIENKDEFYFLSGRSDLVRIRKQRYKFSIIKYKKSLWKLRILSWFPFVEFIALCNSLPLHNSRKNSDIDMFIITQKNRIWLARFFVSGFLKLFRLRPNKNSFKDKLCPSFFITNDSLSLKSLQIENDIYLMYWLNSLLPVFYKSDLLERFYSENNWILKNLSFNLNNFISLNFKIQHNILERLLKKSLEFIFDFNFLENLVRFIQLKYMPKSLLDQANKQTSVVINNKVLKFHSKDMRKTFSYIFNQRINNVNK